MGFFVACVTEIFEERNSGHVPDYLPLSTHVLPPPLASLCMLRGQVDEWIPVKGISIFNPAV
jgi:hypothetical protein